MCPLSHFGYQNILSKIFIRQSHQQFRQQFIVISQYQQVATIAMKRMYSDHTDHN